MKTKRPRIVVLTLALAAALMLGAGCENSAERDPDPVYYTVTFDAGEGSFAYSSTDRKIVPAGEKVTAPETPPTRTGHRFSGWYAPASDSPFDFANTPITADVTLSAHWTAFNVLHSFETDSGETLTLCDDGIFEYKDKDGKVSSGTYTIDEESGEITAEFTDGLLAGKKAGGTYDGNGGIVVEVEGSAPITFNKKYAVMFVDEDGSTVSEAQKVTAGELATMPAVPAKEGFVFDGWLDEDGNEFDFDTPITKDITLTTKWEEAEGYLIVRGTTVTGCNAQKLPADGIIKIPASITSIGRSAFFNCTELTKVTFADNSRLESIEERAFYFCSKLTGIEIPANVASIGKEAFYGCNALDEVTFGSDSQLESIGDSVFSGCTSLTNIKIPTSVRSIGSSAFSNCTGLSDISLVGVKSIGERAFYYCTGLTGLFIPDNVTTIGNSAFEKCTGIKVVTFGSGYHQLESIGESVFSGCTSLYHIIIPSSVTSIGKRAFYGCIALDAIRIPSSVTSIGEEAFAGTEKSPMKLSSVSIGAASIGKEAFAYCTSLEGDVLVGATSIGERAFLNCTKLGPNFTIPASVTSIESQAFFGCNQITYMMFTDKQNWYYQTAASDEISIDVTNATTNAKNLTTTLGDWVYKRLYKKVE